MKFLITTLITLTLATGAAFAQDASDHSGHDAHEAKAATSRPAPPAEEIRIGDPWPLSTCIVSGEELGSMGDPIIKLHEGREVRFCCAGCIGKFESDPAQYLSRADETIIEQQKPFYPLDHCIVDTAEAISEDESKSAYSVVGNRLFILCCPPCEEKVRAEPAKYIAILDQAAIEQQKESYPLDTCVISGQPLDSMGGPINMVIANQLVQLCCVGCKSKVEADPAGTLAKINKTRAEHEAHEGSMSESPQTSGHDADAASHQNHDHQ